MRLGDCLMKKVSLVILLFAFLIGCTNEQETEKNNLIDLDDETIAALKKGTLIGTPLILDKTLILDDVKDVWGEPDEHYDHEDIQSYVYTVENQRFTLSEDELGSIYIVGVELTTTKDEIVKSMGKPSEQSGKILSYREVEYLITFEKVRDEVWKLNLMRN